MSGIKNVFKGISVGYNSIVYAIKSFFNMILKAILRVALFIFHFFIWVFKFSFVAVFVGTILIYIYKDHGLRGGIPYLFNAITYIWNNNKNIYVAAAILAAIVWTILRFAILPPLENICDFLDSGVSKMNESIYKNKSKIKVNTNVLKSGLDPTNIDDETKMMNEFKMYDPQKSIKANDDRYENDNYFDIFREGAYNDVALVGMSEKERIGHIKYLDEKEEYRNSFLQRGKYIRIDRGKYGYFDMVNKNCKFDASPLLGGISSMKQLEQ